MSGSVAPAPQAPVASQPQAPAAPPPDALAPTIDVGTPTPNAQPGQMGSQERPVWYGSHNAAGRPPGDDQVQHDFVAARALAQAGDPWGKLNALIGATGAPPQPPARGQGNAGPEDEGKAPPAPAAASQNPDKPIGSQLVDAPMGVADIAPGGEGLDLLSPLEGVAHGVGAVAKDIGVGAIETPQAALRGLIGAGQQATGGVHSILSAIDNALPKWLATAPVFRGQSLSQMEAATGGGSELLGAAHEAIPAPSTVTGNLLEQGVQFGAGLKGAGAATEGLGAVAPLVNSFVAGASTMDPNAPRLSNLIDEVAPNFLTEWLKAKPGQDTALMGRLKSGLEFAGLGALFDGLKAGLGQIKTMASNARQSKFFPTGPAPQPEMTTETMPRPGAGPPGQAEGVIPPEWEQRPLVEITPHTQGMAETVLEQQAGMPPVASDVAGAPPGGEGQAFTGAVKLAPEQIQDYIDGRSANNPIRINLLRIGSGEDIQNILEQVARTIPEPAVESNEATIRAADASGLSVGDFLNGYAGRNLNAAETTAMRFTLDSSAKQLIDYAKAALDPATATPEAKATFVRAFATHRALQEYFVNARAEAGRTLQSWSIMSQQRAGATRAVQQLIEQAGQQNVDQMAANIASLDDPLQVSRLVAASERGSGRDTFLKVFYNVLLSNPRTVVKKLASDTTMAMWNLATNYAAERAGSGAVPSGETAQLAYGYMSSMKDAIRIAGKGLRTGESQFFKQFQTMDWQDKSRLSLLANGAPETIPDAAPEQAGASWLRAALPTSWIGAADDFAKYWNYRAYVRALAFRDGVSKGLDGQDLATHVADVLDNVPDSIHQQALSQSLRSTFQEPLTGFAAKMQDLADSMNVPVWHSSFQLPVGRIILPFIKVPTNIMRWSYRNTALAKAFPTEAFQAELNAGGASRDLAMARVWLGSAVGLGMADLALNNVITGRGPTDPQLQRAWRAAGNEPYSIQLPGQRPVSYNMVEPMGLLTGAIADTFNIMKFAREDGRENLAAAIAFGTGNAVLSKTYMQGVSNLFEAMNSPDRDGDRIAQSMTMPFVSPQGLAAMAHAMDPYVRAHYSFLDNMESRLPIVSERLPPARTLWGDPIPQRDAYLPFMPTDSFAAKMLSPWQLGPRPGDVEPIDKWIWENRDSFPRATSNQLGISKLGEFQSFEVGHGLSVQAQLTPQQHDRLQVLAGNEVKDPSTQMGAKDLLNSLVTGNGPTEMQHTWDTMSPAYRAVMVQRIVNRYRKAAKDKLQSEFPDLAETIQTGAKARQQQLQGAQQ